MRAKALKIKTPEGIEMTRSKIAKKLASIIFAASFIGSIAVAQDTTKPAQPIETKLPRIHVVYFGGNDCPPCVAFRGTEFIKFQKSEAFSKLEWTFVTKTIKSPIPSSMWLPEKIKPMRDLLIEATNGMAGSAQVVILVDGKVYDVFSGSKDADFYEKMVKYVHDKSATYPGERCLKMQSWRTCDKKA